MAQNQFLSSPFEEIKVPEGFEIVPPPKSEAPAPAPQAAQPARRGMGPSREDVVRRATEMDVDPVLALSIYTQESGGGRNTKTSPKGAMGGFQVMPDTYAQMMGTRGGMDDPWNNMEAGLRYIAYGQKVLKTRDPALLAAGYHAGYNRDSLKRGEIPNVSDGMINTRDYARSVASRAGGADPGRFKPLSPDEVKSLGLDGAEPGRFQPLSPDEVAALTKSDQPADGGGFMGTLTDIGKNLKIGFNTAAEDVRELVGRIPGIGKPLVEAGDAVDRYFHPEVKDTADLLRRDTEAMQKSMTPAMQQALTKKWWDSDKGTFGTAWSDWRSYAGGVVQSLPEQALTMVPAMGLAKGVYAARVAAGASTEAAAAAAATAAQLAGSLSEGLLGGAQSSREVREKVSQLPQEVLDTSEAYQTLLAQGMSRDAARSALANDLSTRAFLTSGVVTGLFGGMGDRAIAKLFTEQVGKRAFTETVKSFGKGALAEGVFEELPQSVGQQLAHNEALKRANPKQSITEDVVNQGLGGMVLGGLQGGGMGALARGRGNTPAPAAPAQEQPAAPVAAAPAAPPAAPVAAPVQPVENAPSKAAGPLQRAVENAAAEPERVTVETPAGAFTGQVAGKSADGQVQVVSDDGEIVTFKIGENGISITPEAPNTPLSNALEVASEQHAEAPAAPPPAVEQPAQPAAQAEPAAPEAAPAPVAEPAPAPAAAPDFSAMGEAELRERLKYLATQAKTNGGWDKKLVQQRRVIEKEINARVKAAQPELAPVAEPAAPAQTEAEAAAPATVEATAPVAEPAAATPKTASNLPLTDIRIGDKVLVDGKVHTVSGGIDGGISAMADVAENGSTSERFLRGDDAIRAKIEADKAGLNAPAEAKKTPSPAALDRIAKGTAYFGSTEKAQAFIDKNGLGDTHRIVQTGKVRFEVKPNDQPLEPGALTDAEVAEFARRQKVGEGLVRQRAQWLAEQGKDVRAGLEQAARNQEAIDERGRKEAADLEARIGSVVIKDGKVYRRTRTIDGSGTAARDTTMDAYVGDVGSPAGENAIKKAKQDGKAVEGVTNGSDQRAQRQPDVAEEVERAEAAPAAPVQPAAPAQEEVAAEPEITSSKQPLSDAELQDMERIAGRNPAFQAKKTADGTRWWAEATGSSLRGPVRAYGSTEGAARRNLLGKLRELDEQRQQDPKQEDDRNAIVKTGDAMADYWANSASASIERDVKAGRSKVVDLTGEKADAPGTRINGDVERAAADRLEKLHEQMSNITNRNSREGNAKAAVRNVIEELRKPKTPVSIAAILEKASSDLNRNFGAFSDVIDTVVESLSAQAKPQIDAAQPKAQTQPAEAPKESNDGSQELDQPRTRELAGEQPQPVQGAEPDGQAGRGAEEGGRADAPGDERAGEPGVQQPGGLGDDAGEVPSLAARARARRAEQGRGPVQRGDQPAVANPAGDEPGRAAGGERSLEPEHGTRAQDRSDNFVITDEDAIGEGGAKTKFKQNIAAIRLLKKLEAEGRQASRKEQAVLAKYVGWGGLPQAFYRDNGEVSKGWEKEAAELKGLLTPQELAAAASSTRNAHYTSPEIVQGVWKAVEHFGFQGGRTLEPSVGVGNFFGLMPAALRDASQLTGVELDHITGGIAKQLYPQANIQAPVGFQDFSAPDNYFELAIGNPPFGREGIYDATRRKISGFSIHNYFFAKSIDTVKPNGVLAMVVTNRLLDSAGDKARAYIAERAEFLGAIRLPNNAFLKNAGTEVTTDIIFLRKLKEGEQPTGQKWMEVKQFTDKNGKQVPLNEYFVRNPEMMLGEFGQFGSMYSAEDAALVARPGQDTAALLNEAIAKLPQGFMDPPTLAPVSETIEPLHDVSHVKVGSVFEQGGQIFERREDLLGKPQAAPVTFPSEKAKERVSGMIQVRDALVEVRSLQLQEGVKEAKIEAARAQLNKVYDAFVKANGPLNADANKRLMRDDPTWPQIAALEDGFDKGVSATVAKATGEKARPPSAKKAAIFFKRTQAPYKAPQSASSAKDALVTSLAERGRVDLDYMASLYKGHTPEAIAKDLGGLIFKNPAGGWETRDQYLSGNVKKKLAQAIEAAKADPAMRSNVEALQAVQPADIEAVDIDVKVGAHWVPGDVMEAFITHVTEGTGAKAVYNPVTASWTLDVSRVPASAAAQWSTDRASVVKVLEAAANQKQITVYDEQRDGTRVFNEAATTAANEKVERVKAEWKNWLWGDDARRQRLSTIYNDTFNTDVQRDFDGSHLTFPGKVGDDIVSLRPHQANAIWRIVQSDTTLLDHVVGAGKTFTVIGAVMEMRRMGLAKKPAVVVPNHLVGQWAVDFLKLYPGANILAATKKDFEKDNRKRLFARIATGDWDAVIIAHSSFGKVEVEPEFQEAFIRQQIEDMDSSIALMRAAEGKSSRNVKQIEKQKAALEEKLKRLFDTGSKDDNLYFGELGIDALFVDEAHEFKNLGFSTGMQRVAGLGNPTGSNKAADLFMKVQATLKRTGGRNVVFATGTPISNTMAEMYTMQRYLDYGSLKDQGIAHFDAWAKTFGEVVTDWELSPSGQYKMNSRFAKFVNMPELMQRYQSFADVVNRDDINRMLAAQGKKLPVPKVATGKPENIVVPRSDLQADYIGVPTVDDEGNETYPEGSLVWRAENLPKKAEKGADNMLKIMSDARKAALDMRLINPSLPDNPDSKVNVAADNIKAIYDQWHKDQGTQLVFIDLSTPNGVKAKEAAALRELVKLAEQGDEAAQEKLDAMSPDELLALDSPFSVYDDLKYKLIRKGILEQHIAFIHDANTELQKEELFAKVRSGRIRVLLGSTAKMGAGMNVQDRLVALHHLDAPWRPSDLEQREGRIIRQGNLFNTEPTPDRPNPLYRPDFEVRIMRYATKQTLDSRMWQTIEAKARFIEQVRKGSGSREVEDIAGEAANSAEMKAASSGNPLILEEMSLRQQIRKLENQQSEHNREQYRIKDRIRGLEFSAEKATEEAAMMDKDAGLAPEKFAATIGNQTFDKHGEAGEAILAAVDAMHKAGEESRDIGTYGGFKLRLDDASNAKAKGAVLTMIGKAGEYQTNADPGSSNTGLALRMQNTVKDLGPMAEELRQRAKRQRADIPKLQAQIGAWSQAQELAEAKARHAAVIAELRPKKKDKAAPGAEEAPAASRRQDLEEVFKSLEGRGLAKQRAEQALAGRPDADTIRYVEDNFWNILAELEDSNKVSIKC